MGRRGYSREHYRRLANGGPDTAEAIAERKLHARAVEIVNGEFSARWPLDGAWKATPEVAREMAEFTARRMVEVKEALKRADPSAR